mmetsp:Transcript_15812/g.34999  ORF Transcript_15812/g.34999 Transcript_15812/m.34999 type:complete len:213 (+) Transcript_15812:421-1059(+)
MKIASRALVIQSALCEVGAMARPPPKALLMGLRAIHTFRPTLPFVSTGEGQKKGSSTCQPQPSFLGSNTRIASLSTWMSPSVFSVSIISCCATAAAFDCRATRRRAGLPRNELNPMFLYAGMSDDVSETSSAAAIALSRSSPSSIPLTKMYPSFLNDSFSDASSTRTPAAASARDMHSTMTRSITICSRASALRQSSAWNCGSSSRVASRSL